MASDSESAVKNERVTELRRARKAWHEDFGVPISAEYGAFLEAIGVLEDYTESLPADWYLDSSLETWFPFSAEELERTKKQVAEQGKRIEQLTEALRTIYQQLREADEQRAYGTEMDKCIATSRLIAFEALAASRPEGTHK